MSTSNTLRIMGTPFPGYETAPNAPLAGLIIVHGIAEHGGRYRQRGRGARIPKASPVLFTIGAGMENFPGSTRTHVEGFHPVRVTDLESVGGAARAKIPCIAAVRLGPQHGLGRCDAGGH